MDPELPTPLPSTRVPVPTLSTERDRAEVAAMLDALAATLKSWEDRADVHADMTAVHGKSDDTGVFWAASAAYGAAHGEVVSLAATVRAAPVAATSEESLDGVR